MPASENVEREVRELCAAGRHDDAATAALRGYGPELFAFVAALHASEADADDVFAELSRRLWRGLLRFGWHSSLRTWAYTIARNASVDARGRRRREVALDDASEVGRLVEEVRTATRSYLRTDRKDRFAAIRLALPIEDQELLILRIDRGLAWKELAQALAGADDPLDDDRLRREAARLRQRFAALKARVKELGRRAGLLDSGG
jgi:RNA polymerase sigma-70 factor (ECF subfamily)